MQLDQLSDRKLLEETDRLARSEREVLTKLLHHLWEIDRRRLYCTLQCGSLLEYCMTHLKYSEDQGCRRISAMRLLRDLEPSRREEIVKNIESGALTLTNIGLAQSLFNHEKVMGRPMDDDRKYEVLGSFLGKSTREAKNLAQGYSPDFKISKDLTFDSISDPRLREKLLQVQGRYAHRFPGMTLVDLLHLLCDNELSAAPRIGVRRKVWARDQARCSNCSSTYGLEVDHRVPKSVGGTDDLKNLRLLCRKCNQRAAIEFFGQQKMAPYLERREKA